MKILGLTIIFVGAFCILGLGLYFMIDNFQSLIYHTWKSENAGQYSIGVLWTVLGFINLKNSIKFIKGEINGH